MAQALARGDNGPMGPANFFYQEAVPSLSPRQDRHRHRHCCVGWIGLIDGTYTYRPITTRCFI
jgi:hypothetical protein